MRFNVPTCGVVAFLVLACVSPMQAQDNNVVIDEDVWVLFLDEPGGHLQKSRRSFVKKDFKAAGAEIEKAAAYCRIEATRAAQDGRKGLLTAGDELEQLARDVKSGTVDTVDSVDAAFAKAHHALAKHHYLKATEAWAKKDAQKTGHSLHAAASYVGQGFRAAGHKVDAETRKAIVETRNIAGKLVSGSGKAGDDVGAAIEHCGKQTEALGKRISK